MSMIIYYSNYCEHSKKLIQTISQSQIKDDMHFICIDKRTKKPNGVTNIILENGQEILSVENRVVIFDNSVLHTDCSQTDIQGRIVLNIVYCE